jgi:hypothetical protein
MGGEGQKAKIVGTWRDFQYMFFIYLALKQNALIKRSGVSTLIWDNLKVACDQGFVATRTARIDIVNLETVFD